MANPVVHFEIGVRDAAKGSAFYTDLFDWKFNIDEEYSYHEIESGGEGGIGGGLFQIDPEKSPPYMAFYVAVSDINDYLSKAEKLGGKVIMPLMKIRDIGELGMFSDPDGNVIGLWHKL